MKSLIVCTITPAEAKMICVKNMRAWVSMVSCLKNFRKIIPGREKKCGRRLGFAC